MDLKLAILVVIYQLAAVHCDDSPIYFDQAIDNQLSYNKLFTDKDWRDLLKKTRELDIVKLERGCGRSKNMLAVLEDGTKLCCRFREHHIKDLRGDVYTYLFNRAIGLWNAPPTVLVRADFSSSKWKQVAQNATEVGWVNRSLIVMALYIEGITDLHIPPLLKDKNSNLTREVIMKNSLSQKDQLTLAQWSDMILHDFIIGHTDRLFSMLYNSQWNPTMFEKVVHNLKETPAGNLMLLDNESGFWMGYYMQQLDPSKYQFQEYFLNHLCIFRENTVTRIFELGKSSNPFSHISEYISNTYHYAFDSLPKLTKVQSEEFNRRISVVISHVQSCHYSS